MAIQTDDFEFLADPKNLVRAVELSRMLDDFVAEARERYINEIHQAISRVQKELGAKWILVEDGLGECGIAPRLRTAWPGEATVCVSFDLPAEDDHVQVIRPYYAVHVKAGGRAASQLRAVVGALNHPPADWDATYAAGNYVSEFPYRDKARALQAILPPRLEGLATSLADKVREIALAIDSRFPA